MNDRLADLNVFLGSLSQASPGRWRLSSCGVTASLQPIPALIDTDAYAAATDRARVVLISGLSPGADSQVALARRALEGMRGVGGGLSGEIALSAVPWANPDGARDLSGGYPPQGNFFNDSEERETRYLWRWLCFQAPDLILEVRAGESVQWQANASGSGLGSALGGATVISEDTSLLAALGQGSPDGLGPIPGLRLTTPPDHLATELSRLWSVITHESNPPTLSPARRALDVRRARSFLDVGYLLSQVYGHQLDPVNYTQGVAISGRLRLAQLDQGVESPVPQIVEMLEPYVSGSAPMFGDQAGGANLAGLIWGEELAEATGDRRYAELIVQVADRYRSGPNGGAPSPCDPDFRTEDMFMAGAMMGRAFSITSQQRYLDLLTEFLTDAHTQQDNGLFWHCRSAPYFWGRGNGFAAMGLTETLTYLPENYPHMDAVLVMYRRLLAALSQLQEPSGMYPQVLDFPGSYPEFTATCMIGYAMARGLQRGWLDQSYLPSVELAWQGVSERVDEAGNVVDACASTGVQDNLKDYLDRPAIFGFDDRSGSMALWFAVEMERLRRHRAA